MVYQKNLLKSMVMGLFLLVGCFINVMPVLGFSSLQPRSMNGLNHQFTFRQQKFMPRTSSSLYLNMDESIANTVQIIAADVTSASNTESMTNGPLSDTLVFIAGIIPFAWATVEFWRRIAVGASFGTGQDSVVIIGEDNEPQSSRGRRVY